MSSLLTPLLSIAVSAVVVLAWLGVALRRARTSPSGRSCAGSQQPSRSPAGLSEGDQGTVQPGRYGPPLPQS